MVKNKILIVLMCMMAVGYAGVIDLDEENRADDLVVQNGNTYRILREDNVFITTNEQGFTEYKRFIVEDLTKIEGIEALRQAAEDTVVFLQDRIRILDREVSATEGSIEESEGTLGELNEEKEELLIEFEMLKKRSEDFQNTISGMVVVSPAGMWAGAIVLIILLVVAAGMKVRSHYFSPAKKKMIETAGILQPPAAPVTAEHKNNNSGT